MSYQLYRNTTLGQWRFCDRPHSLFHELREIRLLTTDLESDSDFAGREIHLVYIHPNHFLLLPTNGFSKPARAHPAGEP